MTKQIRNIAILAHVDAGKTTITENFLFLAGAIKTMGNVDNGTAHSDFRDVEKQRGISIKSSVTTFTYNETLINLIDTPGHVDFSTDVERILRIADGVILVISAADGVQAHTETIFRAVNEKKIPTIIFINKVDRIGADLQLVVNEIKSDLSNSILLLQNIINPETENPIIQPLINNENVDSNVVEAIVSTNNSLLERFFNGSNISVQELIFALKQAVQSHQIIPVLAGSAKLNVGIDFLLNDAITYFSNPKKHTNDSLSALVFGIEHHPKIGKIVLVKIFSGAIAVREMVTNQTQETQQKITQIYSVLNGQFSELKLATAGFIVGICGLNTAQIGDVLGQRTEHIPNPVALNSPLLTVQIKAKKPNDYSALCEAMQILNTEEPSLNLEWLRDENELNLNVNGWIQMEVIEQVLLSRFNIEAQFESPTIIYKETAATSGEGFVQYWMPKPCWAILRFKIEPGDPGSGVVYKSTVSVDKIHQKYQNEVEKTIPIALKQGIKGWEVTDIKITLIDGEDHEVHSRPGDFVVATPMGIMNGLQNIGTTFLEPILSFKIVAPEDLLGAVTGDIQQMRGTFDSPLFVNGKFTLTGEFPLSESIDYPVKLTSRSGGKAKITTTLCRYAPCDDSLGVTRKYKGISPLDTAKYILKARKALQ